MENYSRCLLKEKSVFKAWRHLQKMQRQSIKRANATELRLLQKKLLCIWVLKLVPWKKIRLMLLAHDSRKKRRSFIWEQEALQQMAIKTIAAQPNLVQQAENINHLLTIRARKWMYECEVALWIAENNKKGIVLPPSFVIDKYTSFWGMGPHIEIIDKHLTKFRKWRGWKKWMCSFRATWKFQYTVCPTIADLTEDQIRTKASQKMEQKKPPENEQRTKKKRTSHSSSGPQKWSQKSARKLTPVWGVFAVFLTK